MTDIVLLFACDIMPLRCCTLCFCPYPHCFSYEIKLLKSPYCINNGKHKSCTYSMITNL